MDWNDLRIFLAVQRTGTFAGAGRELGVNATTAARRVAALEEAIGAQLFNKTPDGLVPTAAATSIVAPSESIERHAKVIARTIGGGDARLAGSVRLSVTANFMSNFLVEHLQPFRTRHPEIELIANSTDALVDMTRGGVDLAVRFRRPGTGPGVSTSSVEVVAKRVGAIGVGVYASRAYLEQAGVPERADDVRGHDVIVPPESASYLPGFEWS